MNSFIEERRQNILENNNTAQQDILDILENLHPAISELVFKEPLNGDVDFSILKECNFTNITSIKFVAGNITSIRNLPETISELCCPNNLLIDLEDLPKSLVVLEIPENGLKSLDFKQLQNLKSLHIDKNNFVGLFGLPASLETLHCNNNKIKEIDLEGVENLKTLHCENNNMLVVSHYLNTISDLKMDNNPNLEFEEKHADEETSQSIEVTDAIHRFFKLKNDYEKERFRLIKEIYTKTATRRGAQRIVQNLRYKCVNCGESGMPDGTIFSLKDRNFIAICGAQNKCNLNIKIFAGYFSNLYEYYVLFKEEIENNKSDIIKQKLDTLFQYVDERTSVELFKKEMKEYSENNILLKEIARAYNELHSNEERSDKIAEKRREIDETNSKIMKLMAEYKKTDNREFLTEAIRTHIDVLLPATRALSYLVFELCEIEVIKKNSGFGMGASETNILIQKPNRIQKIDYTYNEPAKVIKFVAK